MSKPPEPRFMSELTDEELRIVRHFALVALYRTPLRKYLDLWSVYNYVRNENTVWDVMARGIRAPWRKQQQKYYGAFRIPLDELTKADGSYSRFGASQTLVLIPRFVNNLLPEIFQQGLHAEYASGMNLHMYLAILSEFVEQVPLLWMEYILPFSEVISETLFDDEERRQYFRVLLLLLPPTHRNLVEVLLVTAKQVSGRTGVLVETAETDKKLQYEQERESLKDFLRSIHPRMPAYLTGDVVDLFRIPMEAEEMLSSPALVDFLSGEKMTSRELLRRCNTYLDVHCPTSSLFSSLHATWSVWSTLSIAVSDLFTLDQPKDAGDNEDIVDGNRSEDDLPFSPYSVVDDDHLL